MSLRVLLICNRVPFPAKDGGAIAMLQMLHGLSNAGCKVDLFCLNTSRNWVDISSIPQEFKAKFNFESAEIDTKIYPHKAFLNLFSNKSYNVSRFDSENVKGKLASILRKSKYDLIQLEGLFVSPYIDLIRKLTSAKIALRTHNVESEIWRHLAKNSSGLKKWYYSLLANRLLNYETETIRKVDFIIPISKDDLVRFKEMGFSGEYFISPTGFTFTTSSENNHPNNTKSVFHLGSMDWRPNLEAMDWFIQHVWPEVSKKHPDCVFHLAGKNTPSNYFEINNPTIQVHGEIDSAQEFMMNHAIMVVPLFSGSGMRIKIVEGMALGKAIITTRIGAEGLDVKHNHDILIADTAQEFISCLDRCLSDSDFCNAVGDNARKRAMEFFDNDKIVSALVNYYEQKL